MTTSNIHRSSATCSHVARIRLGGAELQRSCLQQYVVREYVEPWNENVYVPGVHVALHFLNTHCLLTYMSPKYCVAPQMSCVSVDTSLTQYLFLQGHPVSGHAPGHNTISAYLDAGQMSFMSGFVKYE